MTVTLQDSVQRFRLNVIRRAQALGNVRQACREAGISHTLFYQWKARYEAEGPDGLRPRPPARGRQPRQAPPALEDAVIAYALEWPTHGPARIALELRRERLQGTILTELWRPAFRRTYFVRVEDMQHALDGYLRYYNHDRPHQGYRLRGRTPAELFYPAAG